MLAMGLWMVCLSKVGLRTVRSWELHIHGMVQLILHDWDYRAEIRGQFSLKNSRVQVSFQH